jgi:nicotinamide-nucleotide amidase
MINKAVIISTGSELTTGRVMDTNSTYIADQLFALGVEVVAVLKVGDDFTQLSWALTQARELGDVVIGTGGLGPTADDLTAEAVANFLACKLERDEEVAATLKQRFQARNLTWTDNNAKQALFPQGAVVIPNPVGTAPGFRVPIGGGKSLFWLSGVPQEMSTMLNQSVIPWIAAQEGGIEQIFATVFKIHGVTESNLEDLLKGIELPPQARFSFRAHFPDLSLGLTVKGAKENIFNALRERVRQSLGSYIYAEDDSSLEAIVGKLLLLKNQTLALAESCTGGHISHRVTRIAGSSTYYYGGVVAYANETKIRFLGVNKATLAKYGAVSRETALEMSRGIRERTGASIGFSVTGIAGPSGGSPEKPVGTVWMSIAEQGNQEARSFRFYGDRERIIQGASQAALFWLRCALLAKTQ